MNTTRTGQIIPPKILRAIDHVRRNFPTVDLVVFNAQGDWFYASEDFEGVNFANAPIDDSILEDAATEAKMTAGFPSVFQAYTVDL